MFIEKSKKLQNGNFIPAHDLITKLRGEIRDAQIAKDYKLVRSLHHQVKRLSM